MSSSGRWANRTSASCAETCLQPHNPEELPPASRFCGTSGKTLAGVSQNGPLWVLLPSLIFSPWPLLDSLSLRVPLTLSPGRHGLELGSSGLSVRPVASPHLQLTPPFRVSLITLELWTWVWNYFQYSISVTVGFFRVVFFGGVLGRNRASYSSRQTQKKSVVKNNLKF